MDRRKLALIVGLSLAASVVFIGGLFTFVSSLMKSSEPYQHALETVRASDDAIRFLGEPIEDGFLPRGEISTNNGGGKAQLRIPVEGPDNEGTIYLDADRVDGEWRYRQLSLEVWGQEVDLLQGRPIY